MKPLTAKAQFKSAMSSYRLIMREAHKAGRECFSNASVANQSFSVNGQCLYYSWFIASKRTRPVSVKIWTFLCDNYENKANELFLSREIEFN